MDMQSPKRSKTDQDQFLILEILKIFLREISRFAHK